jgi:hypothetical protein
MARYKVVPVGEASLHTLLNGQEIELKLPDGGAYTPMMKLLAACMLRAEEDLGWWEEMVAWADRQNSNSRAEVKRKQIRLVSSGSQKVSKPQEKPGQPSDPSERSKRVTIDCLRLLGQDDLAMVFDAGEITAEQAFEQALERLLIREMARPSHLETPASDL